MTTKTLILAAATVLSLGVGSAFAEGDGAGASYGQPYATPAGPQGTSQHRMAGLSAGDAVHQYAPNWIANNAGGGGN